MVISTTVFEHLYNPILAISEIGRVLDTTDGYFVEGASFWEAWHGSSKFHITPDGWNALFRHAGLMFEDQWPGWGVIPALLFHVLTPGHFRTTGYVLQSLVEGLHHIFLGAARVRQLQLRASGSYQFFARKASPAVSVPEESRLP